MFNLELNIPLDLQTSIPIIIDLLTKQHNLEAINR